MTPSISFSLFFAAHAFAGTRFDKGFIPSDQPKPMLREIGGGQSAGLRQVKIVNADTDDVIGLVFVTGSNAPSSSGWEANQEYWFTNELWPAAGEWPAQIDLIIMYDCYNLNWNLCMDLPGQPGGDYTLMSQRPNAPADQTPDPAPGSVDTAMGIIDDCVANAETGDPGDCSGYFFQNAYGKVLSAVYTEDDEDLFSVWLQNNGPGQLFSSSSAPGDKRSFYQWNAEDAPSTSGIDNYYWEDPL